MNLVRVFSTELLKLKRSHITWGLAAVYGLAPWMLGLMTAVLKNPELERRTGLLTAKTQMTIGAADWPIYLTFIAFLFVGGMIVMAIVEAFVFGREYAEGTAKNMLILQVVLVSSLSAWIAVVSRGFLAPVGLSILFLLLGDLFTHTGWGVWVPWSIVMMTSGAAEGEAPGLASMAVLLGFFAVTSFATYRTLDRADNAQ